MRARRVLAPTIGRLAVSSCRIGLHVQPSSTASQGSLRPGKPAKTAHNVRKNEAAMCKHRGFPSPSCLERPLRPLGTAGLLTRQPDGLLEAKRMVLASQGQPSPRCEAAAAIAFAGVVARSTKQAARQDCRRGRSSAAPHTHRYLCRVADIHASTDRPVRHLASAPTASDHQIRDPVRCEALSAP